MIITTPVSDMSVKFRRANGQDLVAASFLDTRHGRVTVLLHPAMARRLADALLGLCGQIDDQPHDGETA
ncbi:hypothetical protein [Mycolicibacterium pyrenivorans]|uniref:hypothetical protein n=1 Tax=Mycolicibacterium pyrenivorans TaxID=187102 RepID=UPI0021F33A1C|nr:hypothetical protein [Mycolicibacterium pyrenivorans]MCV7150529.1 hypothetical protein [Mycolicibacterium pyrenivorans]